MSIPEKIWSALEPVIKDKINEIRKRLCEERNQNQSESNKSKIPSQYSSMKARESVVNLVSSFANMDIYDKDNTDEEAIHMASAFMVRSRLSICPPTGNDTPTDKDPPAHNDPPVIHNQDSVNDNIQVRAHFENSIYLDCKD